ncbi:MAG: Phytoene dehydrogenase, partial [uncultured Solirubrobacteraceae bacterium]
EGSGHRRGPGRPRRRPAPAGPGLRRDGGRGAREAGRARLPAARRRLHLGHRAVADHDAVGARGDLRGRRARPRLGGDAAAPRSDVPDLLVVDRRALRLLRRHRPPARRDGEVLAQGRRPARRLPGRPEADLRAGDPRRRAQGVPLLPRLRLLAADDAEARRGPAAVLVRGALLRAPAHPRGLLVPLAVHRRRPASRAGDLRGARLPAGHRRRLVRRRRRLLARGGDGPAARRPLRRPGRAHRARPGAGDRRAHARWDSHPRRRGGLQRRRAQDPRARRAARTAAQAPPDDVGVPALPRDLSTLPAPAAPHPAGLRRLPRLHPQRHARLRAAGRLLDLRPCPVAHRAGHGRPG